MRATEIMISDYLSYEGQIIKVASITKKKVGYHIKDNEYRMHYARLCECESVFITPEILEKNFESESNIFGLQTFKLNENFKLENRGDRFCLVRKCRAYYSSTFWICDLTYLHQLQQALRLCGIEKEIKLEG